MDNRQSVRSFDLFDTLVARRCVDPHRVFDAVEARTGATGFAGARIEVEARIFSQVYTLDDIYQGLRQHYNLPDESARILRETELAVELDGFFPIAEHCAEVRPGDLIISDMYLPEAFIRRIISDICGLPFNPLFLSSHGKRHGTVWGVLAPHFAITQHLGDNTVTDVASPLRHNVPARLTGQTHRTAREAYLAERGMAPLANLIREARLTGWDADPARRRIQLAQIQGNFPLLFVASLHLVQLVEQQDWQEVLFSSRDCYLWSLLYRAIAGVLGLKDTGQYFYTSRVAKANPSPSYLGYFDAVRHGAPSVVVDVCGTGWSTRRLIQNAEGPPTEQFLIHHMRDSEFQKQYERVGGMAEPSPLHALAFEGNNNFLELLNCARHPMVLDVAEIAGQFVPVFSEIAHDERRADLIEQHHAAFRQALTLVARLGADELRGMIAALTPDLIGELYRQLPEIGGDLAELFRHQQSEEQQVWQLLKQRTTMANAAPNLTALANHYRTDKGTEEGHAHDYTRLYAFLFEQFRSAKFSMLEIGLLRGGVEAGMPAGRVAQDAPSIRMWLDYFPNAFCYGFDLSDFSHVELPRFEFLQGDLSSAAELEALAEKLPPLRVLIDDGSHASFHQQLALLTLFDKVESGGFYVIEDFHWQPPFENDLPPCRKTADVFEEYLTTGVLKIAFAPQDVTDAIAAQIRNVFIHRNDSGGVDRWTMKMVAIQKR